MYRRPIVSLGAAFLLTVVAALFAPRLLPLVACPLAAAVVATRLHSRQVVALAVGCLAAVLCCGVYWLGGGDTAVVDLPADEPSLRDQLCVAVLERNPAPATAITLGVVFGYRDGLPPAVRDDLQRSGMAHLLSVSGLHISIAAAGAAALARRLRLGRALQFATMTATTLVFWLASGASVSATRAVIMVLLGLGAALVGRRADGLTSLSLAAVLLVGLHPPLVADLSFQLSFLAVLGILLLAPIFTRKLVWLWQAVVGGRLAVPQGLFVAVATSLAAQLAVTPVVGWIFGSVPLLGVLINLVTIPLVYPVMLLGLAGTAAMLLGLGSVASLLFAGANICSQLLALVARVTASLPFCSFDTVYPVDFAAVGLVMVALLLAICLPTRIRLRWWVAAGVSVVGCMMVITSTRAATNTVSVSTSSRYGGSLMIATPNGTLLVDNATSDWERRRDRDLLARTGRVDVPDALLATHPYPDSQQLDRAAQFYGVADGNRYTAAMLDDPTELVEGVTVRRVAPYCTEIIIGTTKLMKYDAEYDTIAKGNCMGLCATVSPADCSLMRNCIQTPGVCDTINNNNNPVPADAVLLVDRVGNMVDRTGSVTVLRRPDGTSCLRIPMQGEE